MNQELMTLDYHGTPQRIQVDEQGKEWWIAQDACKILGLDNVASAITRIPKQHLEKIYALSEDGCQRKHWAVDEAGLNYLIVRSNKPEARSYQEWNMAIVLPSIRHTGAYSVNPPKPAGNMLDFMQQTVDVLRSQDVAAEIFTCSKI